MLTRLISHTGTVTMASNQEFIIVDDRARSNLSVVTIDPLRKGAHYLAAEKPCDERAQSVCACKPNEYGELAHMMFLQVLRGVSMPTKALQIGTVLRFHFISSLHRRPR